LVADVRGDGRADRAGIKPGHVVVTIGAERGPSRWPTEADIADIGTGDFRQVSVMTEANARAMRDTGAAQRYVATLSLDLGSRLMTAGLIALVALVALAAGILWTVRKPGRHGRRDGFGIPLIAAAATPLVWPLGWSVGSTASIAAVSIIGLAGSLPLGLDLAERIDAPHRRNLVRSAVLVVAVLGTTSGLLSAGGVLPAATPISTWFLFGMTTFIACFGMAMAPRGPGTDPTRAIESSRLVVLGSTPLVAWTAVATSGDASLNPVPLVVWGLGLLVVSRLTVVPMQRSATASRKQRDLIVAAMDAERARLASDIHDVALQDLTLVVRRLDASGDRATSDVVRAVADRLRAICYDLRLPVLDDLGAGPSLEWLVERVERVADTHIALELHEEQRPPAEVELAVYRVAQEALANAVKHGMAPVTVRYEATRGSVALSVRDAGQGITDIDEAVLAPNHFGLATMQQRADQIGATLTVAPWPGGGTEVGLRWLG
jgi:signal transduction histidine kinase